MIYHILAVTVFHIPRGWRYASEIKPIEPELVRTSVGKRPSVLTPVGLFYFEGVMRIILLVLILSTVSAEELSVTPEYSPVTHTVFSGTELSYQGVRTLDDLSQFTPGLGVAGGTSRPRFLIMRGIGERELFEGIPNSSVTTILDGVDLSGIGGVVSLFDIEQVDIYKGSENFLFGPSVFGGSLNFTSSKEYKGGRAQIGVGNEDLLEGGLAFGENITETVAARFSFYRSESDGFTKNLNFGETNKRGLTNTRLSVLIKPWEKTFIESTIFSGLIDDGYDAFTIDNDRKTESDRPGVDRQNTLAVSNKIVSTLDSGAVVSNTLSLSHSNLNQSFDGDWGSNEFWGTTYDYFFDQRRKPKRVGNDLRYEDMELTLGLYASRLTEEGGADQYSDGIRYSEVNSKYDLNSVAQYAHYNYELAPSWIIGGGIRGEALEYDFNDSRDSKFSENDFLLGSVASLKKMFGHDYAQLKVSYAEKQGGVNPGPFVPESRKLFSGESLTMIELGGEFEFLDATWNLNSFYGRRGDQQVKTSFQADPEDPLTFGYLTENAAKGDLYGIESEVSAEILTGLTSRAAASLMRTNIYDLNLPDRVVNGRDQAYAPRHSLSASLEYLITENLYFGCGLSGRGSIFLDDSHDEKSSKYNLLDARFGYQKKNFRVELWGRNLGNERYETRGFYFGNEPPDFEAKRYVQLGDPRTFGVSVSYDW